jgi:hypothetical protein
MSYRVWLAALHALLKRRSGNSVRLRGLSLASKNTSIKIANSIIKSNFSGIHVECVALTV